MPKALQHNYPGWRDDPHAEDSNGESREVWFGAMRVVSAKRARVLRKRGVPLMPMHAVHTVTYSTPCGGTLRVRIEPTTPDGRARYAWFECKADAETRQQQRRLRCYLTATARMGLGRKAWLRERLAQMRREHTHAALWRRLCGRLHRGAVHENVNPQLDLYAKAFAAMQIDTATGHALDALAGVPMPAHWTDEQKRHYIQHGYVVEVGHGDTAHRRSPLLTLYYNGGLADNGEPVGVSQLVCNEPPYNAGVPTHYEPNDYTRALAARIPRTLQRENESDREFVQRHLAAGNVPEPPTHYEPNDYTRSYAAQQHAKYGKPLDEALLDPSYTGVPHVDCDCMACRPYGLG